jgi:hypothetical protein
MAQQMMFDRIGGSYRGQASDGTVVTVTEEAMEVALKRAGKSIYDSDWWTETLEQVLMSWGIYKSRWLDPATHSPRAEFSMDPPKKDTGTSSTQRPATSTVPLPSGPLSSRLTSGKLSDKDEK